MVTKYIPEILKEINVDTRNLEQYKDNYAIRTLFQYAYEPELKFNLPAGTPPYKKDTAPMGMSQANFYQQIRKLYVFNRKDLVKTRVEQLFIQMLESLHPSEAEICIGIKDQNLHKLYPSITRDVLEKYGFVKPFEKVAQVTVTKSSPTAGRNLVLNLGDSTNTAESFVKPADSKTEVSPEKVVRPGRGRKLGSKNKPKVVNEAKV